MRRNQLCKYCRFVRKREGWIIKVVLQYFTALGLHPETGKTLKPITQYMIDKYICD